MVMVALMTAAVSVLFSYIAQQANFSPPISYEVYDAQQFARARWLLPNKVEPNGKAKPTLSYADPALLIIANLGAPSVYSR